MTATVRDNPAENRFEIFEDGRRVGFADYKLNGDTIAFTHTEVDSAFAGRGLARRLVTTALDDARRRGLAVLPFCPYVRKVIAADPEAYLDLVPRDRRSRFGLTAATG
ncbi:GNAT family N-acetyltransferase [Actinoallomurus sp. NPDC052308]|uniref:GNAT family N-acetyltransferase n=1 Tax=Actinoallomurus sp. NPDC052308 TaxID=3155530 RepID=UPI003431BAD0